MTSELKKEKVKLETVIAEFITSVLAISAVALVFTVFMYALSAFIMWTVWAAWMPVFLRACFAIVIFIGIMHEIQKWSRA